MIRYPLFVSGLDDADTLTGAELVAVVVESHDGPATKKCTTQDIADLASGGGGAADLQAVTDAGNTTTGGINVGSVNSSGNVSGAVFTTNDINIKRGNDGIYWRTNEAGEKPIMTLVARLQTGDPAGRVILNLPGLASGSNKTVPISVNDKEAAADGKVVVTFEDVCNASPNANWNGIIFGGGLCLSPMFVPEFVNNAAAVAGGYPVGYVYHTAGVLKIVI